MQHKLEKKMFDLSQIGLQPCQSSVLYSRWKKKLLIAKTSVTYKDLLACLAEENTNKYLVENEIVRE